MDLTLQQNSLKAWILATRPKSLAAGLIPISVGTFLVDMDLLMLDWPVAICALFCAIFITIATNLFNDALDFKKKADTDERLGPMRVTKAGIFSPNQVLAAGVFFLFLTLIAGIPLIIKGGVAISLLLIASFLCSYFYTGGPYPLSYTGTAEPFVVLFYGVFATTAAYFLQTKEMDWKVLLVSLEIGFLSTVLLTINNLRDINEDRKTGKKTLAVRFGVEFGRKEIAFFALMPFVLNIFWIFTKYPLAFFLPMTTLPIAVNIVRNVYQHSPSRIYNRFFGEASLLLILFGILLVFGFRIF